MFDVAVFNLVSFGLEVFAFSMLELMQDLESLERLKLELGRTERLGGLLESSDRHPMERLRRDVSLLSMFDRDSPMLNMLELEKVEPVIRILVTELDTELDMLEDITCVFKLRLIIVLSLLRS